MRHGYRSNRQKNSAGWVHTTALLSALFFNLVWHLDAQEVASVVETHPAITVQRCEKIAALGPRFEGLADACQYALSPETLPNFVCNEAVQQFTSSSGPKNWQNLDLVTDVVTFERGKGDKYSNVEINGRPIRSLSKPHTDSEIASYFLNYLRSPAPSTTEFGVDLLWVFDQRDQAKFDYAGEMNSDGHTMAVFSFQVTKSADHLPQIGWAWPGDVGSYVGVEGLVWIDKETSSLRRIVLHDSDFDPVINTSAYSTSIDYDWIQVTDLGKFLLPAAAEDIECDLAGNCWRNVVKFSNCHKFAAKSRILPSQ